MKIFVQNICLGAYLGRVGEAPGEESGGVFCSDGGAFVLGGEEGDGFAEEAAAAEGFGGEAAVEEAIRGEDVVGVETVTTSGAEGGEGLLPGISGITNASLTAGGGLVGAGYSSYNAWLTS